jgi:hypothetical protein
MARMWSRYGNTEVVVVENGDNGRTEHRATFFQGQPQDHINQSPTGPNSGTSGEYTNGQKH